MAVVANIAVLLVPVTIPVLLVLLSWVGYQLWDCHTLAMRLILGGMVYLVRFLLAGFSGMFYLSFLLLM